ncbi:hypothetical protein EKH55_2890 [Sinorhizobium alkalisoli]|nr:hypothetical protein EKH55_2890 [Sinorhizobium alkalisoli]
MRPSRLRNERPSSACRHLLPAGGEKGHVAPARPPAARIVR